MAAEPANDELCVVCYPFYPTKDSGRGVDRYCFELIENLRSLAGRVRVLEQGSSVGAWAAARKLLRLVAELRATRSGAYFAVSPPAGAAAILCGKRPVLVIVHDLLPFQIRGYGHWLKFAVARLGTTLCVARAAAIVVPFRVTGDELVSAHRADAAKIHVVNYGLDHASYYPRPSVPRSERRVLYVGEVSHSKGVDVLLHAFARVKQRVPHAELVIGGKGRELAELETLARSLGLADVTFRGFVPEAELAELYASAAVMVFPSHYGFGLSTLEAMACGTPVIVTDTLDAPEFIGDAGLLVRPRDADALGAAIERVLSEPALRTELAAKAVARAGLFSWALTAAKTRAVCEAVLAERAPATAG